MYHIVKIAVPLLCALSALAVLPHTARAQAQQLLMVLEPSLAKVISGNSDITVPYNAILTNEADFDIFLNSGFGTADSPLALDDNPFLDAFIFPDDPLVVPAGGSINVPFLLVTVPAFTPGFTYVGDYEVSGGSTRDDFNIVANASFTILVASPAPEPNTLALLGMIGFVILIRRR